MPALDDRAAHDELTRASNARARLSEAPRRAEGHRARAARGCAELADEAGRAAALDDLPAARRQFAAIRREWHDLGAGHDQRSRRVTERYAEAADRVRARATPRRTSRIRSARREALTPRAAAGRPHRGDRRRAPI